MLMDELIESTFGNDITTINKVKVELEKRIASGEVTDIDMLEKPNSILRDIISVILPAEDGGTVGTIILDGEVYEGDGSRYVKVSSGITGGSGGTGTGEAIQGPMGPQGETGIQGYTGSQGILGYTGSRGYTGSQGERGMTGYNGSVGMQGPTGPIGLMGPIGPTGYTGSRGPTGYSGSVGPVGPQGITGLQGPIGMTGFTGSKGETGPAGTVGNAASATLAAKASTLAAGGGNGTAMTFNWSGQSGQPSWLFGGNAADTINVYNPANFAVKSATTATTATESNFLNMDALASATSCALLMSKTQPYSESVREVSGFADAPNTGWWMIKSIRHSNATNIWGTQIAFGWESNANTIYQRNVSAGAWSPWTVVNHDNIVNNLVAGMGAARTVAGSTGAGVFSEYNAIGYEVYKPSSKACQVRPMQQLKYYNCNCNCNCSD